MTFVIISMTGQGQAYYFIIRLRCLPPPARTRLPLWPRPPIRKRLWEIRPSGTRIRLGLIRLRTHAQNQQMTYAPRASQTPIRLVQPTVLRFSVAPAQYATSNAAPVAAVESGDPYGFLGWLNSTRASYGLPAVGYDANLSNWAAMNNNQQAARGMGHFVMGPARRQNAAMGAFANIGSMWMNSPAHRAALLDPTIRAIGIAGLGAYWTFNAY